MTRRMTAGPDHFHIIISAQVEHMAIRHADQFIIPVFRQVLFIKVQPNILSVFVKR